MSQIDRRSMLKTGLAAAAGWLVMPGTARLSVAAPQTAAAAQEGPFTLPPLPYAFDALEPYIDAQTMEIHHDRHHAGYVKKLNAALAGHADLAKSSLEKLLTSLDRIPESIREAIRNNGGGHYNHSLFWKCLRKDGGAPSKELAKAFEGAFGGLDPFLAELKQVAGARFGSGWGWLVMDRERKLSVISTPNQDTPLALGLTPLLGVDVWEHAYYLKYQNKRGDYLDAFTKVIDWDFVSGRFAEYSRR